MSFNKQIKCLFNPSATSFDSCGFNIADAKIAQSVSKFHKSLPGYTPTPLVSLSNLANFLNVKNIFIKDESQRFELNAFKVLGASFAMANVLSKFLGINDTELTMETLLARKDEFSHLTFVTATDGNHGRAVAWAAQKFGCNAVIFMPRGSSAARLSAIQEYGAEASILDCNYDDSVLFAEKKAKENDWILIQDTAWAGYEEIPIHIMQGYFSLLTEILSQAPKVWPTHIFVQTGVGSLAAAILAHVHSFSDRPKPVFATVEAHGAPCFYNSMQTGDGNPHKVCGDLNTIMAGLACGLPSTTAWEILSAGSDAFISCDDDIAKSGMRILGNPLGNDTRIVSGESGAVSLGLIYTLLHNDAYQDIKEELKLDKNSKILLFSTEGDTDPDHYRQIVW